MPGTRTDEIVLNVCVAVAGTQKQMWVWFWTLCNFTGEDARKNTIQLLFCPLEMHNHEDTGLTLGLLLYWMLLANSVPKSFLINLVGQCFVVIYVMPFLPQTSRS